MAKFRAMGAKIEVSDGGATPVWTTIIQNRSLGHSGGEAEDIDATTHDSTGGYRETLSGFKSASTVTFDIVYDPAHASHVLLATLHASGVVKPWRITLTDTAASTITFSASVSQFAIPSMDLNDVMTTSVGLKVAGAIVMPGVTP